MGSDKVLIDVSGLGLSGYEADDWLEAERKLTVGLSDERKVLAIFGVGTGFKDAHALDSGITALAHAAPHCEIAAKGPPADQPPLDALQTDQVMRPAEAFFGKTEDVPLTDAAGRVIAEMVSPYPPGIPRLLPGERITPAHVRYLQTARDAGAHAPDPTDMTLQKLRVVR